MPVLNGTETSAAGKRSSRSLWHVALPSPPHATLTYAVPDYFPAGLWQAGMRCAAPLGNGSRCVVLLAPAETAPEGIEIKELLWPLEREPILDPSYMEMVRNLAARHADPAGRILETILPKGLRTSDVRFAVVMQGFPRGINVRQLRGLPYERKREFAQLWVDGNMEPAAVAAAKEELVQLKVDPPWAVRPGAKRQIAILETLYERGGLPRKQLLAELGTESAAALKSLEAKGFVETRLQDVSDAAGFVGEKEASCSINPDKYAGITPSGEQADVMADLEQALSSEKGQVRLLHGVTGSGKTLVYLETAQKVLESGRQVLLLAPEVALACALHANASSYFNDREVILYHGYQSPSKRENTFRKLAQGGPCIVVGTRSALFLPYRDLGLLVLDEEHDESYKQEERLSYQAKEVAWFRVQQSRGVLVLGSATPDLKTFYAASEGYTPRLTMEYRVGAGEMPAVEIVPLGDTAKGSPLAEVSLDALKGVIERDEQAVIMLNRRGYAPLMYCVRCEEAVKCPNCDVGLTYHKSRERLVCHYCGLAEPFPCRCPKCREMHFAPMGEGTEALEEHLDHHLPAGTGILRLDRDSARRQERMEAILRDFGKRKAQVLVGTQMISKGHDFPDVTLVVVTDADLGLNMPDYRAKERIFQLLVQVSGRAGRGSKPGRVLIQTRSPEHPFWKFVTEADYSGFYESEIELRRKFGYPPFSKLALIRLSFPMEWAEGPGLLSEMTSHLRKDAPSSGVRLLGPAPAPLALLRGRKRFHCLLKADNWQQIRLLYSKAKALVPKTSPMRISLDLDPVNML